MYLDVRLKIDAKEAERAILAYVAELLKPVIRKASTGIRRRIEELIKEAVLASEEAKQLQGGQLQGELGVAFPAQAIYAIIQSLQNNIVVEPTPAGLGSIKIGIMPSDLQDLLSLSEASFISEKGHVVEWLKWLLTGGNGIFVLQEYHFWPMERGRTGLGIMEPTGSWQVPSPYGGTVSDNWLTRVLNSIRPEIERIVIEEIRA